MVRVLGTSYLDFLDRAAQSFNVFLIALLKNGKPEYPTASAAPVTDNSLENVRTAYAALADKRTMYDQMLWQSPMISLTAQAFLLTIALGDGSVTVPKIVSGVAATVLGLASWQLFIRHSAMEREASDELEMIEKKYNFPEIAHHRPKTQNRFFSDMRSKPIWCVCLFLVSLVGLIPLLKLALQGIYPTWW